MKYGPYASQTLVTYKGPAADKVRKLDKSMTTAPSSKSKGKK